VERSKNRVQDNPGFQQLEQYIGNLKQMREETRQSLKLTDMMKRQEEIKLEREKLEKSEKVLANIMVVPSAELEKKDAKLDKINEEQRKEWFKGLNKDLYLGEAVEILNDTIVIKN
jgi:carboxyl-terminal processing protease